MRGSPGIGWRKVKRITKTSKNHSQNEITGMVRCLKRLRKKSTLHQCSLSHSGWLKGQDCVISTSHSRQHYAFWMYVLYVQYGLVAKTFCQLHASNTYRPWCVGEYAKTSSMCVVPFFETCISKELRKDAWDVGMPSNKLCHLFKTFKIVTHAHLLLSKVPTFHHIAMLPS